MIFHIGEEITSAYLQYIKGCEIIQRYVYTPDVKGDDTLSPLTSPVVNPLNQQGMAQRSTSSGYTLSKG